MRLVSLNVGRPRIVLHNGEPVSTGIFKEPVTGPVRLRRLNLDGDRQADLTVHGGVTKAVYAYPSEHYEFWKQELPGMDLPYGMFGENFTVTGLFENEVNVGDRLRVGSAELMVTEPRLPCYKLGIKFGRSDIIKRFLQSRRTGFYLSVLKEGDVAEGNEIELADPDPGRISISEIVRLHAFDKDDVPALRRVIELPSLDEGWRTHFRERLEKLESAGRPHSIAQQSS